MRSMQDAVRIHRRWRGVSVGLLLALAGAVLYALLDPVSGRGRRARLRDRSRAMVRRVGRSSLRLARRGATIVVVRTGREPALGRFAPDDRTLLDRIESRVFQDHHDLKGRVVMDCEGGQVCLRGELPSQAAIAEAIDAVRAVDGVVAVRSLLHLAGTPAPNKEAALRASTVAEWREQGW